MVLYCASGNLSVQCVSLLQTETFAVVKSVVSQFLADDVFSFKLVVINVEDFFGLFSVKELSTFFSRRSEMRL